MGAVSTYRDEIAEEICRRIAEGEPLRQICREPGMPAWRTVYDWKDENPEFAARIAHARELGEEAIAEECLDIADNATNDWMEKRDSDGVAIGWQVNGEHIQRSKLRIETRLKLLAKWNPKRWGDKADVNVKADVQIEEMSPVERAKRVALVMAKGLAAARELEFQKAREEATDNG